MNRLFAAKPKAGILMSGGEDYRSIAALMKINQPKDVFIFSESNNFEERLLRKLHLLTESTNKQVIYQMTISRKTLVHLAGLLELEQIARMCILLNLILNSIFLNMMQF
jgi:hypothetical protein